MPPHRILFTIALTITSRVVQVRDRLLGRLPRSRPDRPEVVATQHSIPSGSNILDAVYVSPSSGLPQASVLICHGIGEIVSQWFSVQRILAENGVASVVFDYSGYGRSTGRIDWLQCEQDAVCAFQSLQDLSPSVPVSILGFSLGSGVAPAILNRITAHSLVLCGGFSSFRRAARAAWIPAFLAPLVPPIWSAQEALRNCSLPILVVHGDRDRLFPLPMAHELVSVCGNRAELLVLPARTHNSPVYKPHLEYWGPIVSWLLDQAPCPHRPAK